MNTGIKRQVHKQTEESTLDEENEEESLPVIEPPEESVVWIHRDAVWISKHIDDSTDSEIGKERYLIGFRETDL